MTQDEIFRSSEGNRYHERNRHHRLDPSVDVPIRLLDLFGLVPRRVLEIGAGDGQRIALLAERFGSEAVAVEPSGSARREGADTYPLVQFLDGTAAQLPDGLGCFDLVIVNFVLHWVDRETIAASIEQVEAHVEPDGGLLLLGDFLPRRPQRVPYHHLPAGQMFTFKADYPAMFLDRKDWELAALLTGEAKGTLRADADDDKRVGWALLRRTA
jgi:SAM-dependent methyltransferase